jgi:hypothetical protein
MRWLVALALACVLVAPLGAARDNQSSLCPLPIPTGERMDARLEIRAWRLAKRLVEAPKKWKRPGAVVRFNDFATDYDGVYGGFYYSPTLYMHPATGIVVACEYIEVHLPPDSPEGLVVHVLTHEYLHGLAGRKMEVAAGAIEGCSNQDWMNDGCEAWVQSYLPNPEGWTHVGD